MQLAWMTGSDDTVFDVVFVPNTPSSMMFHSLEACPPRKPSRRTHSPKRRRMCNETHNTRRHCNSFKLRLCAGAGAPVPEGSVIGPEDAAPDDAGGTGSAKMGEGEGTQSGDQGATKENDTQKVGQPPRRNPTTNNGDSSPEQ